jgi:uncharacterized protein (UPF0276 family)
MSKATEPISDTDLAAMEARARAADITVRLLESAHNDPEAELLMEARDKIERLRQHIHEQAAELERVKYELAATSHARETIRALQKAIDHLLDAENKTQTAKKHTS